MIETPKASLRDVQEYKELPEETRKMIARVWLSEPYGEDVNPYIIDFSIFRPKNRYRMYTDD